MTDSQTQPPQPTENPHALDAIQPDAWVNIPKCIGDAFQLLVSQAKASEIHTANIDQTIMKSHEQLETEFKAFAHATGISEKEIAKLIEGFRDTLNRTLKNFSLEVTIISEMALENKQKVQHLQELTKNLKKGQNGLEDNALQKLVKELGEELSLKFDMKEANLKDYVSTKLHELNDIPGLVGPGKKFSHIKSLLKHLHDNCDSKLETITELVENKNAFFKKAFEEMDLPNKIKSVVHREIRQHVMPEIEKMDMTLSKHQEDKKESTNEKALMARIQSLEELTRSLEAKFQRLEAYNETVGPMDRFEEVKETAGSITDVEIRTRSKSDSRELNCMRNKLSRNLLWKDHSDSKLIEEVDDEIMSPQMKDNKGGIDFEGSTEEKNKDNAGHQLVTDLLKERTPSARDSSLPSMNSIQNQSSPPRDNGSKSPTKGVKPVATPQVPVNKYKRSATISLNRNAKTPVKGVKETDESFQEKDNSSPVTNKSGHSFSAKSPVFDPSKFDLKQMGSHTFEFLSILEHEFDAIYTILADLYNVGGDSLKAKPHDAQAQQRQNIIKAAAVRGASVDRDVPVQPARASPMKNASPKVTAYQLLKALTKRGEDDPAPPKEEGPSQQEILSRPPLIRIGPQGLRVNGHVQANNQGQGHLPQLPQRARLASDSFSLDRSMDTGEGHNHGQGQMNNSLRMSPPKMRATNGNGKPWISGITQPHQQGMKDNKLNDSSFETSSMTGKEIGDNDREDAVIVPLPGEKTMGPMQEISLVRQRAATNTYSKDAGERVYG